MANTEEDQQLYLKGVRSVPLIGTVYGDSTRVSQIGTEFLPRGSHYVHRHPEGATSMV